MFRIPFGCCASNCFLESCATSASARSDFSWIDSWTTRKELQNHQLNKCTWSWDTWAKTSRDIQNYTWHTRQWWLGFKRTTCRICSTATSSLCSSNCKRHIKQVIIYYCIKLHSKHNCTTTESSDLFVNHQHRSFGHFPLWKKAYFLSCFPRMFEWILLWAV